MTLQSASTGREPRHVDTRRPLGPTGGLCVSWSQRKMLCFSGSDMLLLRQSSQSDSQSSRHPNLHLTCPDFLVDNLIVPSTWTGAIGRPARSDVSGYRPGRGRGAARGCGHTWVLALRDERKRAQGLGSSVPGSASGEGGQGRAVSLCFLSHRHNFPNQRLHPADFTRQPDAKRERSVCSSVSA